MVKKIIISAIITITACSPAVIFAGQKDTLLQNIYNSRGDLQAAFESTTWLAKPNSAAGLMLDLPDWASQYGWKEYAELASYKPLSNDGIPNRIDQREIESSITSAAYVVIDKSTGIPLTVKQEHRKWPMASITKLMTAHTVMQHDIPLTNVHSVKNYDNVGGAKLYVSDGDTFTVNDLFYATLVASANNAANALSRTTGLSKSAFVKKMNANAKEMNLQHTTFVDPTGIEVENFSTPMEIARMAREVLKNDYIKKYSTTATKHINVLNQGTEKKLTNTNWMLWKPQYDDIYVTGGKTGFLYESKWNLVVTLRPNAQDVDRELLVVALGADSRAQSFNDAEKLAQWAWDVYRWEKQN